jgi:hypothetical protein
MPEALLIFDCDGVLAMESAVGTSGLGREEPVGQSISLPQSRRPTCDTVKLSFTDAGFCSGL